MSQEKLKYPIGRFRQPEPITPEIRSKAITDIATLPGRMRVAVSDLTDKQLDTPYRPDGWTVRQVVHHCADSHMNAMIRIKLALTEDQPTIKPYEEPRWAMLPDTSIMPIEAALTLLDGLHARWAFLLQRLTAEDLARSFIHPDSGRAFSVDEAICQYAWHSDHHLSHITHLRQREGWDEDETRRIHT
ncbi:MAG: putative metal-dependent hydrolase [Saprospiraceae bacterium]|nr:putative metal-dependent hydrolase [Saprospiraceae bacterium]